ncbi:hypothetical protein [Parasitella parasitica]|uniref:Uncharacterized protein n=1 Tax=Parasitella parasitica TaxID=35722 RepID=A0A0B7N3T2_9FUNG|nr:hypothetical protein [Parasitella parasitica]
MEPLSSSAVRYLGYALYHTESRLSDFLDGLLVKVQRHCNLLKQRNLSIRGAGLAANSLLLFKVYHLLCVVTGPITEVVGGGSQKGSTGVFGAVSSWCCLVYSLSSSQVTGFK